jgi:hypothetical protein
VSNVVDLAAHRRRRREVERAAHEPPPIRIVIDQASAERLAREIVKRLDFQVLP